MSSSLLDCRNLTLARPGPALLHFPDFSLERNTRLLLLGPSGSGKTTLLSLIAGLLKPISGQVLLDGSDFYHMPPGVRDFVRGERFGFVFQTLHLLPSLTLRQNIALAADMTGRTPDQTRLDNLLETLELTEKAHRKPDSLSQGEQQRAAIARAVFNRPSVIIADEPTSALDDANARTVIDLLVRQAEESGAALLIATHDTRIINQFDTVIRLNDRALNTAKEAA
jgi:putative ABC transport system ATP-binding protein